MVTPRRAGVLGHPIEHSLSPVLHRAAYAALGLDWTYDRVDVQSDALAGFLHDLDEIWAGVSLTMPLKVEAVRLVDFVEPMAKLVGVVNTVLVSGTGSARQLVGANTDVYGIARSFREAGVARVSSAVIVGGGATATSAMAALSELGCASPTVVVRDRARAGGLVRAAAKMGTTPRLVSWDAARPYLAGADAVVSTIPAEAGAMLSDRLAGQTVAGTLLDAVYDPLMTPLRIAWEAASGASIAGTRMLLHQAAEQVRLMSGLPAPVQAMESALVSHLSQE